MSTVFAVYLKPEKIDLVDDSLLPDINEDDFVEVARRSNKGEVWFSNSIAHLLPDSILVYPLCNSAQGIHTIGDVRRATGEVGINTIEPNQTEISDDEIERMAEIRYPIEKDMYRDLWAENMAFMEGMRMYREQLKSRQ